MAEFVWKKKQTQNLVSNILLKTTFNKEKKLLCLCLKLEFVKWRAIYDGVGDVILGEIFPDTEIFQGYLGMKRKLI